jgi:ACS family D-galactonate transporter-like MFS transporter
MFLWVYALCSPLAGVIGDRFSKKRLITISLCLWSTTTFVTGLCRSPIPLLACRSLIGVTEALFYPAAAALIADAHGPLTRSRALAFFNSGSVLGVVGGGWYGGYVGEHFQWRFAFYSLGAVGALYALPLLAFIRGVRETNAPADKTESQGAGVFFRTPTYLLLCIVYSIFLFAVYLLYTWLPNFLTEKVFAGPRGCRFYGNRLAERRQPRRTGGRRLGRGPSSTLCSGIALMGSGRGGVSGCALHLHYLRCQIS